MQIKSNVRLCKKQNHKFNIQNINLTIVSNCDKCDSSHLKKQGQKQKLPQLRGIKNSTTFVNTFNSEFFNCLTQHSKVRHCRRHIPI